MDYIFRPTFNTADSKLDLEASGDIDDKTNLMVKLTQVCLKVSQRVQFSATIHCHALLPFPISSAPPRHLKGSGKADLEISHSLDRDTNVKVKVNSKSVTTPKVEISHRSMNSPIVNLPVCRCLVITSCLARGFSRSPFDKPMGSYALLTPSPRLDNDNTIKPRFDLESNHLTCAWVRKLERGRYHFGWLEGLFGALMYMQGIHHPLADTCFLAHASIQDCNSHC